jgi:hypothetical protein
MCKHTGSHTHIFTAQAIQRSLKFFGVRVRVHLCPLFAHELFVRIGCRRAWRSGRHKAWCQSPYSTCGGQGQEARCGWGGLGCDPGTAALRMRSSRAALAASCATPTPHRWRFCTGRGRRHCDSRSRRSCRRWHPQTDFVLDYSIKERGPWEGAENI